MKAISKIFSIIIAPFVFAASVLTGCFFQNKPVVPTPEPGEEADIMRDINVAPTVTPAYAEAFGQAFSAYKQVADAHKDEYGEVDWNDAEVSSAARTAAAKMFAYARYNLYYLDKFVYFADQEGSTDLGPVTGTAAATKQEYYIRVNENPNSCGYRYHYTIKSVDRQKSTGLVAGMAGLFESGRIRITDQTDRLYRFECEDMKAITTHYNSVLKVNVMSCPWVKGKDWNKPDLKIVKRDPIAAEDILKDIEENAGANDVSMPGNVNILAENVLQAAKIMENDDGYILIMNVDTAVANKDAASLRMLRNANDSNDCVWQKGEKSADDTLLDEDTGLKIVCALWKNGLVRQIAIDERWTGTIKAFNGSAKSYTCTYYSYSDRDCDMTVPLKMIAAA